ncbi:hypothetical protein CGCF415_v000465 [Colletotrichum fructicola]|uniref:Uncharacterized protein n=1 Tax=Colletotrichum fructicola (strain Nara gc5) TaxID=1213859 RepID=A0A7J6JD34_COLFN|nr:uncharacterized protein CGMCC3_g8170 [Colletotrichum fructicola]KAF4487076.1 hypothetical protein CGGC5_v005393 [Colletotrichum fructicola Nara gc5]KAE9575752.1 hypothetical protein CGMCC3_g8170 [Colletotrichum fructicola]KAF4423971.1 hypothetical protein CFRS1_v006615 [Colletotrichum fructicola]KAF4886482.1 hypothetical protein CGCFRS4_v011142 [Colletotrichum fructicola]KAF4916697.1 hypothetical protein CGCF415_v000465 [Colletotrichum fructicola]
MVGGCAVPLALRFTPRLRDSFPQIFQLLSISKPSARRPDPLSCLGVLDCAFLQIQGSVPGEKFTRLFRRDCLHPTDLESPLAAVIFLFCF